jgi:hypothetical protein
MNCTETSLGLLFIENPLPYWVEYLTLIFLILIFFTVKYFISNYQDFIGARLLFFFLFTASFVYLCINSSLLLYPISQYESDFTVSLNYQKDEQEVILSSENNKYIYTDNLKNYKGFYVEFEHSSQKSTNSNSIKGNYHLYLLRKDGLLISLDTYGISRWQESILPILEKTPLPLITEVNLLDIPINQKEDGVQLSYDINQLSKNIKSGRAIENNNETVFQYNLHGNKIINHIIIPLLLLFWTGAILNSLGSYEDTSNLLFKYLFLVLFTAGWCFYYVINFGKQTIVLSSKGYKSYTITKYSERSSENTGEWKDVKKAIAYIRKGTDGITIYETDISTKIIDLASAITSGKTKVIRLDGLEWYDQILLADYVLFKSHSPE